jgi:hypothetical protein
MQLNFKTPLDLFTFFIIIIKIIFILSAIGHVILSHLTSSKAKKIDPKLVYWKERTEFIFVISMSVLLIYHFNPRLSKKEVNKESALLFFLFGWVLIFTAKWSLFINEANWYKKFVSYIS